MRARLSDWWHRRQHRRGRVVCRVVCWWSRDRRLMVGYFCERCLGVFGTHRVDERAPLGAPTRRD